MVLYMERILIIGCSCAGKSTLARTLGKKLHLPVTHLDQLWWKEGWENVSQEEFNEKLQAVLDGDRWIIDGNYGRTMEMRLQKCDTVIYLEFSRWACLWGLLQRLTQSYGRVRPDMSAGCPERFDWEFVKWIWNYNRDNRVKNSTYLAKTRQAEKIILKSRREVRNFLAAI